MTLKDLKIGKSAVIHKVGGEGALRQHILDMGLIPGVEVTMVKFAAIAAIRRELGSRWAIAVVFEQCAIAWIAAGIVRLAGLIVDVA